MHRVIVLEATRVLRPERRHPLLSIRIVVRIVRDVLLAGLRMLHATDLIVAAYVTRIVLLSVVLLQRRIVTSVSLTERLRATLAAYCAPKAVNVQLADGVR